MWLTAANLGFTAGGALLYWIARRRLLLDPGGGARRRELFACALVALLALSGFALAHVGMNLSLTGRIVVTDARWLAYALVGASALLAAHFLLRLQRSKADELVLPVAAFLAVVGLVNIYVWESRDANAYVSTVALPALREYQDSIAEDGSLSPDQQADILEALGPVPNELEYESGSDRRFATVLDTGWREAYNRAVAGFETARTLYPGPAANLPVHEVELDDRPGSCSPPPWESCSCRSSSSLSRGSRSFGSRDRGGPWLGPAPSYSRSSEPSCSNPAVAHSRPWSRSAATA